MIQKEQTWDLLEEVLTELRYKRDEPPGQRFRLVREDENNYAKLFIFTYNIDTYNAPQMRHTRHEFVVPVATYNEDTWVRWVHDAIQAIEAHETDEWFFYKGKRIYAPHHGNGENPYAQWYTSFPEKKSKSPGDD